MTKFGRFSAGEKDPYETYEGDYLTHAGNEFVHVMIDGGQTRPDRIAAVISLQKGESLRNIS